MSFKGKTTGGGKRSREKGKETAKQDLTPSQRLWAELFGFRGIPELNQERVLTILDCLPPRERLMVRLRFGFGGRPLTLKEVARKLPRVGGGMGVSRQRVQQLLPVALSRLRHRSRRQAWQDARA